ncbi:DODA-type extradiol aromatic ring-opening family dioxygenase [Candidatus Thiodiazotropha sp. CDECU1]|uniref:DODA-type extradiol aromatic ring-opening family dioxygenase n=1 Tax=Candidatus Thiodiazotropha sp. CDECU1 TaxID=3065865 RepID=UPI00292F3201|nr:class III extradiol ring-cleavage dioxygenase [Candidatus Thiodiazotropha sp. CDECU1]
MKKNSRVIFISHGGGPLPLLGDDGHKEMVECLKEIAKAMEEPSAIIVVSAHWEEAVPTVTSARNPPLIYDYYGFPQQSYSIEYPCPGEPSLAGRIQQLLQKAGMEAELNDQRGFDHGLFVPLKIIYPDADIPCVQLSLVNSLDPMQHIRIGEALRGLRNENLLIIGSGFSFHNMRAFFSPDTAESRRMNESFEAWLVDTCSNKALDENERAQRLNDWLNAPYARYCHPREEHLLPLHLCYGFARSACSDYYELEILNKKSSMYLW